MHPQIVTIAKFGLYCAATILSISGFYLGKPIKLPLPAIKSFEQAYPDLHRARETLNLFTTNAKLGLTTEHPAFSYFRDNLLLDEDQKPRVKFIGRSVAYQAFAESETYSDFQILALNENQERIGSRESRDLRRDLDSSFASHEWDTKLLLVKHQGEEDAVNMKRDKKGTTIFWVGIGLGLAAALLDLLTTSKRPET